MTNSFALKNTAGPMTVAQRLIVPMAETIAIMKRSIAHRALGNWNKKQAVMTAKPIMVIGVL
jgi:hypothetical protein